MYAITSTLTARAEHSVTTGCPCRMFPSKVSAHRGSGHGGTITCAGQHLPVGFQTGAPSACAPARGRARPPAPRDGAHHPADVRPPHGGPSGIPGPPGLLAWNASSESADMLRFKTFAAPLERRTDEPRALWRCGAALIGVPTSKPQEGGGASSTPEASNLYRSVRERSCGLRTHGGCLGVVGSR